MAAAPATPTVDYTLAPELHDGAVIALAVTIRLRDDLFGTTTIDWSASWADETRFGQWARDVSVEGADAVRPAPHGERIIRAAPGVPHVMRYRIVSSYAVDPDTTNSQQALTVVRPTWFYAVGEALYATPTGRADTPARLT